MPVHLATLLSLTMPVDHAALCLVMPLGHALHHAPMSYTPIGHILQSHHIHKPSVSPTTTAAPLNHALPISHVSSPWPSVLLPSRPCTLGAPGVPGSPVLGPMLWRGESGYWLAGGVSVAERQGNPRESHLCHHPHMSPRWHSPAPRNQLHLCWTCHQHSCECSIWTGWVLERSEPQVLDQETRPAKGSELSCVDSYCLQCRWNGNPVPGTAPVSLLPETPQKKGLKGSSTVHKALEDSGKAQRGLEGSPLHIMCKIGQWVSSFLCMFMGSGLGGSTWIDQWAVGCCWRRQNSRRYSH